MAKAINFHHSRNKNKRTFAKSAEVYNLSSIIISTALLLEKTILFLDKLRLDRDMTDIKININKLITKTHFGVDGRIVKNGKILLIRKARGPYTGLYDLPGGSQEEGESYLETLTREIMEETGCEVIKAENERFKSIIFSDFTVERDEKCVLQHEAILHDVEIKGEPKTNGDGLDSNGAVWVDIKDLTAANSTPYALMAAHNHLIAVADKNDEII